PLSRLKEPEFLLPLLEPFLTPNLIYDSEKTRAFEQQELEKITTSRGMVKNGELIVAKGSIISDNVFQKLESYKGQVETNNLSSQKYRLVFLGYLVLTALILGLYFAYLRNHAQRLFVKLRWLFFLLGWVVLYTYLMYGITVTNELNPYLIPFCIAPIVIKNFYRRELALVTYACIILMVGLITTPGYEFILLQFLAGFVATFARFETRYWGNFFKNIFTISLVYMLGYVGLSLIEEVNFNKIDWSVLTWLALNGFLTLLAYPLIPLLGGFFGFTSSITLAELSDLNHPLLKEMSLKAPGTLQHSLQVSNLAESAANRLVLMIYW
ncbi:MAG: hypothetical protein HC817_06735, partial [Saprospiraceae bacterium]|nr:hypothetical protein [Saprospiraceae bacterium]